MPVARRAVFASGPPGRYARSVRRITLLLPVAVLLGPACSYYDTSLLEATGPSGGDAGQDVSVEAGKDADQEATDVAQPDTPETDSPGPDTATCGHARPPDPPATSGGGGTIDFVVAVDSVDFGDATGSPKEIGYDLDSRCTCLGEGNSCLRESWATADACDGPDGRDNSAGALMTKLSPLFSGFGSGDWSEQAKAGAWSIMLRVREYNGEANDDQVRLDWYVPDQFWEDKDGDEIPPLWDGNDAWPIRSTSLEDAEGGPPSVDEPKFYDLHAYVTNGVIVASFPESAFQVSDNYLLQFVGSFITARVVSTEQGWALEDGILASRWTLKSILAQISRLSIMDMPVCTNHIAYSSLKEEFCSRADIYSGVGTPTTPCDSMSSGMRFTARPAKLGTVMLQDPTPNPCEPALDPANDSCGN